MQGAQIVAGNPITKTAVATWIVTTASRSVVSNAVSTTTQFFLTTLMTPTITVAAITAGLLAGAAFDVTIWGTAKICRGVSGLVSRGSVADVPKI